MVALANKSAYINNLLDILSRVNNPMVWNGAKNGGGISFAPSTTSWKTYSIMSILTLNRRTLNYS